MKKRKVPHTFVIVFFIIVIAAVLTWIIPPGKYVSEQVDGETVMTFYYAYQLPEGGPSTGSGTAEFHAEPQTWQIFSAFYKGFVKQSNIIVFILIIGGAFWIMNKSKAIAQRIDYWLANPEERWRMGHVYAKEIQKYDIRRSVAALLDMFQKAIDLNKKA